MFEIVFTKYNDEDEINYYLDMTAATIEYCFRLMSSELVGGNLTLVQNLRYFTRNPNKLPIN